MEHHYHNDVMSGYIYCKRCDKRWQSFLDADNDRNCAGKKLPAEDMRYSAKKKLPAIPMANLIQQMANAEKAMMTIMNQLRADGWMEYPPGHGSWVMSEECKACSGQGGTNGSPCTDCLGMGRIPT